jgi:hypothetical protein
MAIPGVGEGLQGLNGNRPSGVGHDEVLRDVGAVARSGHTRPRRSTATRASWASSAV